MSPTIGCNFMMLWNAHREISSNSSFWGWPKGGDQFSATQYYINIFAEKAQQCLFSMQKLEPLMRRITFVQKVLPQFKSIQRKKEIHAHTFLKRNAGGFEKQTSTAFSFERKGADNRKPVRIPYTSNETTTIFLNSNKMWRIRFEFKSYTSRTTSSKK
jgi:hypothetical protein